QNRYRIVSTLGQGGMGAVYKAWDIRLDVHLALKEMIPQPGLDQQTLDQLRRQFQREAQILARLSHSNLVRVTDFFEEDGNVYLVMDFVEGESLSERIAREGALPESLVLEWSYQLLDALDYCHAQGILHRDIKPQNIIIRFDGRAVLVDFGLVKLWNPNDPHTRTAMRGMGTPEYAPPEQYDAQSGHTDPRSDIYGLGATIYHALTGQTPPTATMRIASPHVFHKPRALSPNLSPTTEAAVLRATELMVDNRFASAQEMMAALKGQMPASAPAATARIQPSVRTTVMPGASVATGVQPVPATERKRVPVWVWAVGGVAILALIAVVVMSQISSSAARRANETATAVALAAMSVTDTPSPTPSPSSTPSPTETPTLTSEPTDTPKPTNTPRPTSTPKGTPKGTPTTSPTPTPSLTPTASPTPTPETPMPTNTARPTSPPTSGALITFEQFGSWRRGDQPNGELTQTREQVKTGSYAAKLRYNFPASGDDYVVFLHSLGIGGQPNTIGAWVYGDGSGHLLNVWIQDTNNEIWSVNLGRVGSAGWQQLAGRMDANASWPSGHVSGPDNGAIDYPIRFHALVLDRTSGSQSGQIYIDDISAWQGTAAVATSTPAPGALPTTAPAATSAPPPPGAAGRIFYTIDAGATYYLGMSDPTWSQGQVLDPMASERSTCAGGATAVTLAGQTVNLFYGYRCAIGQPKECASPNGEYKVVLWEADENFSMSIKRTADDSTQTIYIGPLNWDVPILWAPDSSRFYFVIGNTLHTAAPQVAGYQPVLPVVREPYLSPDGSMILYLQAVGTVGAYDIMVSNADGSNPHNVTGAPDTYK
ncbi:MAG: protein kinase, partial [Anaerolineae bacterium]